MTIIREWLFRAYITSISFQAESPATAPIHFHSWCCPSSMTCHRHVREWNTADTTMMPRCGLKKLLKKKPPICGGGLAPILWELQRILLWCAHQPRLINNSRLFRLLSTTQTIHRGTVWHCRIACFALFLFLLFFSRLPPLPTATPYDPLSRSRSSGRGGA